MSEAELMEISNAMWSNAISIIAIFITILSGYLIISYVAGKNMEKKQVQIITALYVGLSVFMLLGFISFSINAGAFDQLAFEMSTQRETAPRSYLAYIIAAFLVFCHLGSLKFMWDVRNAKNE